MSTLGDSEPHELSSEAKAAAGVKKKRRSLGTFPCPDCDKVFSRSDHLSRHHLNHEPKVVYECDFIIEEEGGISKKCGKKFVRKDLKERHTRRHLELMKLDIVHRKRKASETNGMIEKDLKQGKSDGPRAYNRHSSNSPSSTTSGFSNADVVPVPQSHSPLQISNLIHNANEDSNLQNLPGQIPHPSIPGPPQFSQNIPFPPTQNQNQNLIVDNTIPNPYPQGNHDIFPRVAPNNYPQTQNDILSWLFTDSNTSNMLPQDITPQGMNDKLPNQDMGSFPVDFRNPNPNPNIPSPFGGSQLSPQQFPPNKLFPQQQQFNPDMESKWPNLPNSNAPINEDPSLTPFYNSSISQFYHQSSMQNLNVQDMNFFQNEDNPLEEVLSKAYQQQIIGGKPNGTGIPNVVSTLSSNSPTSASESVANSTPKTNDLVPSPESFVISPTQEYLQQLINMHGTERNITKNKHIFIDSLLANHLFKAIPTLNREKIEACFEAEESSCTLEDRLSYYLEKYWTIFHPQFTILHRPSFDTSIAEPLLVLAMIVIGCNYSVALPEYSKKSKKSPEFHFSMLITVPLRFMVFQHEDFKTPVKPWILQTLNLLEWSEKNFLLRGMHERAHIHHGTIVQLLRRSPLLGGNPATTNKTNGSKSGTNSSTGEEDTSDVSTDLNDKMNSDKSDATLFMKWVESESMKRITFMTFYLDIIDYVKFRHNPLISFYQLQLLNLPCDDEKLWESEEVNGSFRKIVKRQKKLQSLLTGMSLKNAKDPNPYKLKHNNYNFLNALKKMLKSNEEIEKMKKMSVFTKKILFGGLVSVMYQMQQTDLQNNSSLLTTNVIVSHKKNHIWKEILSKAIDNWSLKTECYGGIKNMSLKALSYRPYQCKFPMFHLTQIIGMADINHYDIAIFGGSKMNQSVEASKKDHLIVRRKLNNMWMKNSQVTKKTINEIVNLKSVIHCYLILWELMLKPTDDSNMNDKNFNMYIDWSADHDYYDCMYAIGIATLVLWSYAFSIYGLESHRFTEKEQDLTLEREYEKLVAYSAEGGYQYLVRIRQEFLTNLRKNNLHNEYTIHPIKLNQTNPTPHEIITKHCELLPFISNKQNISGLCFLVGTKLLNSQWEVIRENAKLVINCGLISIGKVNLLCDDLFDNEFED